VTGFIDVFDNLMVVWNMINFMYSFANMLAFGVVWSYTIFTLFSIYKNLTACGCLSGKTISAIAFCFYYNIICVSSVQNVTLTRNVVSGMLQA